jgi:deuterolysin
MGSKMLLLAAMAATAMAACPLTVEFTGAEDHTAHIAVTNTGTEAVTVFKGNTVLSEDPTLDLVLDDAGMPSLSLTSLRCHD